MSEQAIEIKSRRSLVGIIGRKIRVLASRVSTKTKGGVAEKKIRIGRNTFTMFGSSEDQYFRTLQGEVENFPALMNYATRNLKPDSVILDVGANIGLTALLLCTLCPKGHIYAFEASPINAVYLRRNIATNSISNCTVIETAVGNEAAELTFHTSGAGSHVMTDAHMFQSEWPSVKVPVAKIDDIISTLPVDRLDFIKMDIEGFEPMALAGAVATIAKFKPSIFMEFNSWSLYFAHRFDPMTFAKALWQSFEISTPRRDGSLIEETDPVGFVYTNMTKNGCVTDILLKPKSPFCLPSLGQMVDAAPR